MGGRGKGGGGVVVEGGMGERVEGGEREERLKDRRRKGGGEGEWKETGREGGERE